MKKLFLVSLVLTVLSPTVFAAQVAPDAAQIAADKNWECSPSAWVGEPKLEDGVFRSTRSVNCRIKNTDQALVPRIYAYLKGKIEGSKTIHISSGPVQTSGHEMAGISYQAVDKQEEDSLTIDEELTLKSDQKSNLLYKVDSKKIEGSGNSSFLRKVFFGFYLNDDPDPKYLNVVLTNTIQVERPWYAPAPIFESVAKGKAEDKFEVSKNEFLTQLSGQVLSQKE